MASEVTYTVRFNDEASERIDRLTAICESIDRNLQAWTDAHRKPASIAVAVNSATEADVIAALRAGLNCRIDPPDEVA